MGDKNVELKDVENRVETTRTWEGCGKGRNGERMVNGCRYWILEITSNVL
jgi:hypothetical protein